jgi:ERCC4-type nuclease
MQEKEKKKPRLLVDTREQLPLSFNKDKFDIVNEAVPFGDYWNEIPNTDGTYTQIPICFERKGIGDLFGTMGKGYERFKREMERCKEAKFHMILAVEGTVRDVHNGYKHSSIAGESMLKKLAMLRVRYDLEVLFFEDRKSMAKWIEEVFDAVHRNYTKPKS